MRLAHTFSPLQEICVLFDDNEKPIQIMADTPNNISVGCIFLARVIKKVENAFFVELEKNKNAYLNAPKYYYNFDGQKSEKPLQEGDFILVEVCRPASEDKDLEVKTKLSISIDCLKIPTEKKACALFTPERTVLNWAKKYALDLSEIITDDSRTAALLKNQFDCVTYSTTCIYEKELIAEAIDEATNTKAPLKSGGSLITEQTSACICFDVNSGVSNLATANQEACNEILRQIKLKGLGGQFIIDFAGQKKYHFLKPLLDKLSSPNINLFDVSKMGLVEGTIKKDKQSVFDLFTNTGKSWQIACKIARELWFATPNAPEITITAPALALNYLHDSLIYFEERLNLKPILKQSESIHIKGITNETP